DLEETDLVGQVCPNDVAALQEALNAASRILRRRLEGGSFCPAGTIEVEDEQHRQVLTLPLRAAAY
ncbi:MAG TPA: hypothetical protein VGB54_08840, partial [Allosphingosinicella sp.]